MIPERAGVTVDSTVRGENIAMAIDESAMQHLMNILTDLYSDPELAVIREYVCNAYDSHVEAGQTRPVEITTPTDLRPLLTIRDYGVGLDAEDIRNIYSRYGASTKRATNDAVGMLGLGCKSALAFVDQFTLAGIKDGQRMLVSIARDENGAGTMTVLESGPTDEPDGVEVCVPASSAANLEDKARDFLSYWDDEPTPPDESPVIEYATEVDGEPEFIEHDGKTYEVIDYRPPREGDLYWAISFAPALPLLAGCDWDEDNDSRYILREVEVDSAPEPEFELIEHDGDTYQVIDVRDVSKGNLYWNVATGAPCVANFDHGRTGEERKILRKLYRVRASLAAAYAQHFPTAFYAKTGEVREPLKGEFYLYDDGGPHEQVAKAAVDYSGRPDDQEPILEPVYLGRGTLPQSESHK